MNARISLQNLVRNFHSLNDGMAHRDRMISIALKKFGDDHPKTRLVRMIKAQDQRRRANCWDEIQRRCHGEYPPVSFK